MFIKKMGDTAKCYSQIVADDFSDLARTEWQRTSDTGVKILNHA